MRGFRVPSRWRWILRGSAGPGGWQDGAEDGPLGDACRWSELAAVAVFRTDVGPPVLEEVGYPADEARGDAFAEELAEDEVPVHAVKGRREVDQD